MEEYVLYNFESRVYTYYRDMKRAEAKLSLSQEPACIYRNSDKKVLVRNYYMDNEKNIIFPKEKIPEENV